MQPAKASDTTEKEVVTETPANQPEVENQPIQAEAEQRTMNKRDNAELIIDQAEEAAFKELHEEEQAKNA